MTEVTLFINSDLGSAVLDVNEELVMREIRDRLQTEIRQPYLSVRNRHLIAEAITKLLVERANEWISGLAGGARLAVEPNVAGVLSVEREFQRWRAETADGAPWRETERFTKEVAHKLRDAGCSHVPDVWHLLASYDQEGLARIAFEAGWRAAIARLRSTVP